MGNPKWTPGPWRYEPGGGHASNRIVGSESVQTGGWPERRSLGPGRGSVGNASYSDRVCENLGDTSLPGPAANARLIAAAPEMYEVVCIVAGGEISAKNMQRARALLARIDGDDHA